MQPCIACIWKAGLAEPSPVRVSLDQPLTLDRELFGITNASVSRTPNAPRLSSVSSRRVRLTIPDQCATGAVVIQRLDFTSLQRRISTGQSESARVHAALFGCPLLVARGEHSALGLLRSASVDAACPDQLVTLPVTTRFKGPTSVELDAPSIVLVGAGAVAVLPGITVLPESGDNTAAHSRRFRLPALESLEAFTDSLDAVEREHDSALVRVAGWDDAVPVRELSYVAKAVLGRVHRSSWFVPALVNDRDPRLCLFYERQDGTGAALVSTPRLERWLRHIEEAVLGPSSLPTWTEEASGTYNVISAADAALSSVPAAAATRAALSEPVHLGHLSTTHAAFGAELQNLSRLGDTDLGILLLGESGTGKEHLAHAIHATSKRAKGPFVEINVAALPESLIETELFGHVRGAYTGTQGPRGGAFVTASGGTLLLDEIGDAPLRVQLALLRVLETRRVRAVGADHERPVDVRVIAATSRDLGKLMREERFRPDLYYRLADLSITVPPLRERLNDIPLIANGILKSLRLSHTLSKAALGQLKSQRWSGNIRALRSVLRRAAQLAADSPQIELRHLCTPIEFEPARPPTLPVQFPDVVRKLGDTAWQSGSLPPINASQYERRALQRAALLYLAATHGRLAFAADLTSQWAHLFGERWAITENQRGLRDVMRQLGATAQDETTQSWVLELAGVRRDVRSG